jgi:hypothetical protein
MQSSFFLNKLSGSFTFVVHKTMAGGHSKLRGRIPFLVFVVCTFGGIAIGYLRETITAGTLTGLGAGLIFMVLLRFILYRKKEAEGNLPGADSEN